MSIVGMQPVDISTPPVVRPRFTPGPRLPWILLAVALLALVLALVPRQSPPVPPVADLPEPVIAGAQSGAGLGMNFAVERDAAGHIRAAWSAVRPFGDEEVWCKILANGQVVAEQHATGGEIALCIWIRP